MYFSNQRISIELDPDLIDWVDQIIGEALKQEQRSITPEAIEQKRIAAIETAIQNWCEQQNRERLQRSADIHRQRHHNDETGWLV